MPVEQDTRSGTGIVDVIVNDPIPPASAADDQKANDPPAQGADESKTEETPEQQEAKKESRRARSNARKATELAAARTEARIFRERAAELEAKLAKPAADDGEPKREQFEDDVAYVRAVGKYDAQQAIEARLKSEREAGQQREQQQGNAAAQEKLAQDWVGREKAFQAATADYDTLVKPFVEEELGSFSGGARRMILESEVGPNLLHHLASHPDTAERISELSPVRQVAELGKLEATMSAAPARKTSDAPRPPSPLNGGGRSALKGYSDNMSETEYREWRKANGARWAK